jgi:redox-sensing transcriptional repressor
VAALGVVAEPGYAPSVAGIHRRPKLLPEPTVARLPIYERIADEHLRRGLFTVSSDDLGRLAGVSAATVRRDLSAIGPFGTRGSGYDVEHLSRRIGELLGANTYHPTVIAGVGHLARALINSPLFGERTARIVALYDVDPAVVGTVVGGLEVRRLRDEDVSRFETPPQIGILTCPASAAQEVADGFCELGIRALMTFSPKVLRVPTGVTLRYVDVSIELQILSYHLEHGRGPMLGGIMHNLGVSPVRVGSPT